MFNTETFRSTFEPWLIESTDAELTERKDDCVSWPPSPLRTGVTLHLEGLG